MSRYIWQSVSTAEPEESVACKITFMRKQTTLWLNSTYVVVSLMHISPVTGAFRETTERNKLLVDATGCLVRQGESVWRMLRS